MLTPNQLKNHTFTAARGSYKAAEVDQYMNEVIESYQQMFKENGELLDKLELLAKRIEEYRDDEDKIKRALIVAEKTAQQIKDDANAQANIVLSAAKKEARELNEKTASVLDEKLSQAQDTSNDVIDSAKILADNVISQAKSSSEEILINAKAETEAQQKALNVLKTESTLFKNQLLEMYESHIAVINNIPALAMEEYKELVVQMQKKRNDTVEVSDINEDKANDVIDAAAPEIDSINDDKSQPIQEQEDIIPEDESRIIIEQQPEAVSEPVAPQEQNPQDKVTQNDDEFLKFGEDYDISDDADDGDDDNTGFKGFFKRKK